MIKRNSIGILGGTFDPIHIGHTGIANHVLNQCRLDKILLIPNFKSANKTAIATAEHRFMMTKLATAELPGISASDIEITRQGVSYSIDTIQQLKIQHPNSALSFIIGDDILSNIDRWKGFDELLGLCHLVVVNRQNSFQPRSVKIKEILEQHQTEDIHSLHNQQSGKIYFQSIKPNNISATKIRQMIKHHQHTNQLNPAVLDYIVSHKLYQS